MMHIYRLLSFTVLLLVGSVPLLGQIGGNKAPLQYSVHTYSIEMDEVAYNAVWNLYSGGTTAEQIEAGAVPLVNGTHYTRVGAVTKSGGRAYFTIQFSFLLAGVNTPTATGNYVIGYLETTVDGNACATSRALPITVYAPFDLSVTLASAAGACPDSEGTPLAPGNTATQTAVEYLVSMEFPGVDEGGYLDTLAKKWSFNFELLVDGEGSGTNATIVSITASGAEMLDVSWTPVPGSSSYIANCEISPSSESPVTITAVINDVLGVDQTVNFRIYDVKGPFEEIDVNSANNIGPTYTIYSMPNVGDIVAWN